MKYIYIYIITYVYIYMYIYIYTYMRMVYYLRAIWNVETNSLRKVMHIDCFHNYVSMQKIVIKFSNKHFCVYLEQVFGTVFAR